MYTIKMTRCTGESGIMRIVFPAKSTAEMAVQRLQQIDAAKSRANEMKYDIIEIGNSAEITK